MKAKKSIACILAAAFSLSLLTACGNSQSNKNNKTSTASSTTESSSAESKTEDTKQESSFTESKPEDTKTEKMHTLYIRDSLKNDKITATFINSVSGKTVDVPMTKTGEVDDSFIYTCQADTNLYNMVHLNYGNNIKSKDVSFNSFTAGWYLMEDSRFSYDPLLPYAEGMDVKYDPEFETKTFRFDEKDRSVFIWTPDNYDAKSADKYSTIYFFDGEGVLATGVDRGMNSDKECLNAAESITGMMSVTDNKAIVVAVCTCDETREDVLIPDIGELYNPPGMPAEFQYKTSKKGNDFADFICDTIMPYVQKNYNVYTDARHNALFGSSLGGLETFYTVLTHPDKFGTGGVLSSTFGTYAEQTWEKFLADKVNMENAPFLYMYAGKYGFDNGDVTKEMYDRLTKMGYPKDKFVYDKYERGTHLMVYWRNIFSEFLQALFLQKVEALEFGAEIEYQDKSDMRTQTMTEIKIDENDPRLLDKNNYVYFDNSETKWENVYGFWWSDDEISSNIISGGFYEAMWPGMKMEKIGDTDIYRIIAPEGATSIIFDSGVTDDEVRAGVTAYQTYDIVYKTNECTGKVFKIDMSQKPKAGRGVEATKFVYLKGEWSEYKE